MQIFNVTSNSNFSSSTRILISSGIPSTGWVSFNCITLKFENSSVIAPCCSLYFLIISFKEALTNKYCCLSLNILPDLPVSFGYSTLEILSARFFKSKASEYCCEL